MRPRQPPAKVMPALVARRRIQRNQRATTEQEARHTTEQTANREK
jgi:hypothetical protein